MASQANDNVWIDPDMQRAFARMAEIATQYDLPADRSVLTPEQARRRMELDRGWWNEDRPELARIVDTAVPGPGGDVAVRLLYPVAPTGPLPVIVYLHGGGWVVGSLETHARGMHYLALKSGCLVAAVDYSRAPEAKFPVAIEETVAVVEHLVARGGDWGADPARIALAGDSAGANLAVGAVLELRHRGASPIGALGLIYGVFGDDLATGSYQEFDGPWALTTADMKSYFTHYLRGPDDYDDPRAVPMKADVTGFPPSFLHCAGVDVLRDDSVRFDAKLRAAGVPGDLVVHAGVTHGFMGLTRMVPKAHAMIDGIARDVTAALDGVGR
ncbi:MAG: alpha/beta hydrolase fold domain-containing protein [Alphaproteobacteria bacterium]|nr:alpha/beta hydrolase fold domain-containing protein [Alphaproteobacteria bacterium]